MKNIVSLLAMVMLITACGPNPEKSDRLVEEGVLLAYYAKYEEAIQTYNKAIKYNDENFEAYFNRGNAKASLRRYKDAIEDFSMAIKIHPKYADAFANRGQMKFYLDDDVGACEDWKMAESLGKPNMNDKTRFCN